MLIKKFISVLFGVSTVLVINEAAPYGVANNPYDPNRVWETFYEKDRDNKTIVEYQIRNIPETRFSDAVNLMIDHYLTSEPIHAVSGFGVDQNEIQKYMYTLRWLEYLERNLSVACFKIVPYSEDEMTGLAILYTLTKDEYSKQIPICKNPKRMKKFIKPNDSVDCNSLREIQNFEMLIFERYNVDKIMSGDGLVVAQDYRGRGIAKRIIMTMEAVSKEHNIEVATCLCTSNGSNRIADKDGYDCIKRLSAKKFRNPKLSELTKEIMVWAKKYNHLDNYDTQFAIPCN